LDRKACLITRGENCGRHFSLKKLQRKIKAHMNRVPIVMLMLMRISSAGFLTRMGGKQAIQNRRLNWKSRRVDVVRADEQIVLHLPVDMLLMDVPLQPLSASFI
ncbi:MAG TPA: hypothetical protein V6C72_07645, partial [Chroococcales cyanobacterium]